MSSVNKVLNSTYSYAKTGRCAERNFSTGIVEILTMRVQVGMKRKHECTEIYHFKIEKNENRSSFLVASS